MTASGLGSSTTDNPPFDDTPSSPRAKKKLAVGVAVAAVAVLAAACGSSGAASTTTSTTMSAAAAAQKYLDKSGTGNKTLAAVTLPSKWTVTWTFNCQNPATTGTFSLASTGKGIPTTYVTSQTGLGGGGHKPYTKAGSYTFIVKTTCGWKVTVGSTPTVPVKSVATTTTPKKSTTTTTSKKSTTPTT